MFDTIGNKTLMAFGKMRKKSASIYMLNISVVFMKEGVYFWFGLLCRGSKAECMFGYVCLVFFYYQEGLIVVVPK